MRRLTLAGMCVAIAGLARVAAAAEQGEVVVVMVAEDGKGHRIADLRPQEVVLEQDGARQAVRELRFVAEKGWYELRYAPVSGQPGAVTVRVARNGVHLRGPDGPQLNVRWVPPVSDFEKPLRAALDAASAPAGLDFGAEVLRFEARDGTLHHTVLAEVPFGAVTLRPNGSGAEARLAFFLRVKAADGSIVQEGGLDQPLDLGAVAGSELDVRRFIWSSHAHLRPGQYVVEVAVADPLAAKTAVRRMPLVVEPWAPGLRVGSLVFLFGAGGVMAGQSDADDPLRLEDAALVPMLRPTLVAGSEGPSSLLLVAYPDRQSSEPLNAWIELHRDGQLRAKTPVPLPSADAEGRVRTAVGVKFAAMHPGTYVVKFVAQQGAARAESSTDVVVTPPPRVN